MPGEAQDNGSAPCCRRAPTTRPFITLIAHGCSLPLFGPEAQAPAGCSSRPPPGAPPTHAVKHIV
ncbi:hypothetical protein E2C01_015835 [Portunus trituberculatus]|uniref:Uncharacterized protein n=1 Tax=Portunus trituberculatus TaxID=210409 RepID=A0A5B7DP07_PORTR|nr:hypothetical protein [Portunus trituberculatus]